MSDALDEYKGSTPLCEACFRGDRGLIADVLRSGANVNEPSILCQAVQHTPLTAVIKGWVLFSKGREDDLVALVRLLLDAGACVTQGYFPRLMDICK